VVRGTAVPSTHYADIDTVATVAAAGGDYGNMEVLASSDVER
jgi:hypothetical protein